MIEINILGEGEKRALARLFLNPDFRTFLQVLEDEKVAGITEMLTTQNAILIHQLQGSTQMLVDITRAVMLAPDAVAAINRK